MQVSETAIAPGSLPLANSTYVYVAAFVDELQRSGVHNVVICPGSRSTPLAMVIAAHPAMHTWMHIDERSAAFFALGMAKHLQTPVALLCTSGTAAANFYPAIVEAKLTHVPLLVLTADRPPELRDCGAPQAIDQNRLYGVHVKWFVEVALPEASNTALRYIRTQANRAAEQANAIPAGPVHINFPFREPLIPEPHINDPLPPPAQRDPIAWNGRPDNVPYVETYTTKLAAPTAATVKDLAKLLATTPRGLIVVGPSVDQTLAPLLVQVAARLNYPILADPLSQLRSGEHRRTHLITSYDAFLRSSKFVAEAEPQLILRFGAMPTSKPLLLYIKQFSTCHHIVIDGQNDWNEPTQLATAMLHTDPVALCQTLLTALADQPTLTTMGDDWLERWLHSDQVTRRVLQEKIQSFPELFEGRVFQELNTVLTGATTLFAGNSMPVRDLDTFFWGSSAPIHIQGNRGANGIDGLVSTALGIAAASDRTERVVLVIGDLSLYHDLNGLLAAHLHKLDLTIILVNNDGGGIFSFLPQAAYPNHFEQLFGTPIGLDMRPVVEMYGGNFQTIRTWDAFRSEMDISLTTPGLHVLEIQTERANNVTMHRQLWQAVEQALQNGKEQAK